MRRALQRFDHWWFGHQSPVTLGLLRILLGACAFISLALTLPLFRDWYHPDGFLPKHLADQYLGYDSGQLWGGAARLPFSPPRINLLFWTDDPNIRLGFYLLTMAAAVGFTVGWRTRICGLVLVLGVISLHLRAPLIIHSGDTLLRLCLIYLVLSPSGAALSIDQRRSGRPISPVRVTGQRLIAYQVAICYLLTAWWKGFGTFWIDGTATYYPARMHEFMRFPVPGFIERQPFIGITTYGTLIVEVLLGTLVFWKPARKWVLILGLMLHGYIEYRFNIPMFAFIITSCYVAFYDGHEVEAWLRKRAWGQRLLGEPGLPQIEPAPG